MTLVEYPPVTESVETKIVRLGDVASFIRGITFKPADLEPPSDENVDCMRTKNVQVTLDTADVWSIPRDLMKRPDQLLRAGDILISSANSWNLVGKGCWIPELARPTTFGGFVTVLRAYSDETNARYLYRWFTSNNVQETLRSFGNQTTNISNLNLKRAAQLQLPLPPLPEQRRIAAILDKADHLRTQRREALAHLDALAKSIFDEVASQSTRSPTMPLESLVAPGKSMIRTGPFGSQLLTSEFVEEGIAVLGIDNAVSNTFEWKQRRFINEEKYEQLKRYTVHPGDLIITIMGTLGRCAVIPKDIPTAINTKHLCCITLNRDLVVPEYLHAYFLQHEEAARHLRQTTKGSIMGGLNMGIIKAMPIVVPPLDLQRTFARRVAGVERLKDQHRTQLAELDTLFTSLQYRAFSGQL